MTEEEIRAIVREEIAKQAHDNARKLLSGLLRLPADPALIQTDA